MILRPSAEAFKKKIQNKEVSLLEAGVFKGNNSKALFENFNCKILYLIDSWRKQYEHYSFPDMTEYAKGVLDMFEGKDNVIIIRSDVLKFDLFKENMFDYIYLDDSHTYDHIKKELPKYWEYLKKGGMMSGDNYENPGIRRGIEEFCTENNVRGIETKAYKKAQNSGIDVLDWWIWK